MPVYIVEEDRLAIVPADINHLTIYAFWPCNTLECSVASTSQQVDNIQRFIITLDILITVLPLCIRDSKKPGEAGRYIQDDPRKYPAKENMGPLSEFHATLQKLC